MNVLEMEFVHLYSPYKDDIALEKNERVKILPSILECQHSLQYLCTDSFHYIVHLATDNLFIVNKLSSSTSNISGQV